MLQVESVAAGYDGAPVLHDISMNVGKGQIVVLLGSNGAGKTTLLRTISGLLQPRAGTVRFDGVDVTQSTSHSLVRRGMSHCPEGRHIFKGMNVHDNLRAGGALLSRRALDARLGEIYEMFPRLADRQNQAGGSLSGGEQQMLAIGRSLMAQPRLLLLDEPSLGLAPIVVSQVFDTIRAIAETGTTILLVEQNAHLTLQFADYVYVMERGRIAGEGESDLIEGSDLLRTAYLGK